MHPLACALYVAHFLTEKYLHWVLGYELYDLFRVQNDRAVFIQLGSLFRFQTTLPSNFDRNDLISSSLKGHRYSIIDTNVSFLPKKPETIKFFIS